MAAVGSRRVAAGTYGQRLTGQVHVRITIEPDKMDGQVTLFSAMIHGVGVTVAQIRVHSTWRSMM